MTPPRQCFLADLDITAYVLDWGELDEVQSVLLAQAQLFVGQVTVKVDNAAGLFSPGNPSSPLYGQVELDQPIKLFLQGSQVFGGLLKNSEPDFGSKTADLVMENQFSSLASTIVVTTQAGVNPALALLGLLDDNGFSAYVDRGSFHSAAGASLAVGAVVDLTYAAKDKVYLLKAINDVSELAGLSVFVHNNVIFCTAFQPYEGDGSGLRQPITSGYVREWGRRKTAYNTFYNQVTVPYGASSSYQASDFTTQKTPSTFSFTTNTGGTLAVPDLASATFFGDNYLARAARVRDQITIFCGIEFADAVIGYRYPVVNPFWGYDHAAFEVIETLRTLSDNGITLTLARL